MSKYDYSMTFSYMSTDTKGLDTAVERGFDWIVTGWLGHSESEKADQPVYLREDKKLTALRTQRYANIQEQIEQLSTYHAEAHKRGLKVALFTYEPSVPSELRAAYPEVFYPYPQEYLALRPVDSHVRMMCIYDSRVQEWVSRKVAETIENIWPIDAWMFTCSETMWGSGPINHICANCYDKPRWEAIKHLYLAIAEGIRRSGRDVKLVQRAWALQHPDEFRRGAHVYRKIVPYHHDLQDAMIATIQAGERPYIASRDYPRFMEFLKSQKNPMVVSKATWADFLLHQPVNPWVGHAKGEVEEIIELSLEPCFQYAYGFIPCVYLKQIQEHIQYGLQRGAKGIMLMPIEAEADWGLNLANLDVGKELIDNPQADVRQLLATWTQKKYGGKFDDWLVEAMLESEDICADLASYNGMCGMVNFDMYRKGITYLQGLQKGYMLPMFEAWPDHKERFDLTEKGLTRAVAIWNRRVRQAKAYNDQVQTQIENIPEKARKHVLHFFDRLETVTLFTSLMQKMLFTRVALEFEKIKPSMTLMRLMERWDFQIYYLIASDEDIRDATFTNPRTKNALQIGAWRFNELTEIDAFPGLEERETVVNGWAGEWKMEDGELFKKRK